MTFNYSQGETTCDKFLCTLDALKITTDNDGKPNFVGTTTLLNYWIEEGVVHGG